MENIPIPDKNNSPESKKPSAERRLRKTSRYLLNLLGRPDSDIVAGFTKELQTKAYIDGQESYVPSSLHKLEHGGVEYKVNIVETTVPATLLVGELDPSTDEPSQMRISQLYSPDDFTALMAIKNPSAEAIAAGDTSLRHYRVNATEGGGLKAKAFKNRNDLLKDSHQKAASGSATKVIAAPGSFIATLSNYERGSPIEAADDDDDGSQSKLRLVRGALDAINSLDNSEG